MYNCHMHYVYCVYVQYIYVYFRIIFTVNKYGGVPMTNTHKYVDILIHTHYLYLTNIIKCMYL